MSLPRKRIPLVQRFWAKVVKGNNPDDCWAWIAGKNKDGYGSITVATYYKLLTESMFSWLISHTHTGVQTGAGTSGIPNGPLPIPTDASPYVTQAFEAN